MKLAMDVTADGDRRIDPLDIGFFDQQLSRFQAQLLDLRLADRFASLQLFYLSAGLAVNLVNSLCARALSTHWSRSDDIRRRRR